MKTLLRITFAAMLLTSLFSCEKATMEEEGAVNKPIELGSEIKISFDANNISNPSYDGDDEASRNGNTALKNKPRNIRRNRQQTKSSQSGIVRQQLRALRHKP